MKRIVLIIACFAALSASYAQNSNGSGKVRYYNAAELNVIGKAIPTSKNFTRIDTAAYKFNDEVIEEYACHSTGLAVLFATDSPFIKEHCLFKDESLYDKEYRTAMAQLCGWTMSGKNKHDDVPDAFSMLSDYIQNYESGRVTVMQRIF